MGLLVTFYPCNYWLSGHSELTHNFSSHVDGETYKPGLREDGYETWTVKETQYFAIREVIEDSLSLYDKGDGVALADVIRLAEERLTGHLDFESGRFTNWVRWIKVDMEVEGAIVVIFENVPAKNPLFSMNSYGNKKDPPKWVLLCARRCLGSRHR